MPDLNVPRGNTSHFVSFPLFGFTLVMRLRNFDFLSLKCLIFFLSKKLIYLNMSCLTVSDLVYASFFEQNCGNKLRNTDLNFIEIA